MVKINKDTRGFSVVEVVIVIAVVVVLVVVGLLIYNKDHKSTTNTIASSSASNSATGTAPSSALSVSSEFMAAITDNNSSKAISLSTSGSRQFVDQAAPAVEGSYTETSSVEESGNVYVLYSLTNTTNKYARVTLQETSGTWKVSAFDYSANQLKLVP